MYQLNCRMDVVAGECGVSHLLKFRCSFAKISRKYDQNVGGNPISQPTHIYSNQHSIYVFQSFNNRFKYQ